MMWQLQRVKNSLWIKAVSKFTVLSNVRTKIQTLILVLIPLNYNAMDVKPNWRTISWHTLCLLREVRKNGKVCTIYLYLNVEVPHLKGFTEWQLTLKLDESQRLFIVFFKKCPGDFHRNFYFPESLLWPHLSLSTHTYMQILLFLLTAQKQIFEEISENGHSCYESRLD